MSGAKRPLSCRRAGMGTCSTGCSSWCIDKIYTLARYMSIYNSFIPSLFFLSFLFYPDIVNCDLKSTLRVLYNLFTRYRNVDWAPCVAEEGILYTVDHMLKLKKYLFLLLVLQVCFYLHACITFCPCWIMYHTKNLYYFLSFSLTFSLCATKCLTFYGKLGIARQFYRHV